MLKAMIFIDYQNFNIASRQYYYNETGNSLHLDYNRFIVQINQHISYRLKCQIVKTYLFAAKPCDQLLELSSYKIQYDWLNKMKSWDYLEVIEGRQEVRSIDPNVEINVHDSSTYTTTEKGTDVNVAVTMLSKAYSGAYDVAILVSGDTDYIPAVEVLHQLGKIVIVAHVANQNVSKYNDIKDAYIKMDVDFLNKCAQQRRTKAKQE